MSDNILGNLKYCHEYSAEFFFFKRVFTEFFVITCKEAR